MTAPEARWTVETEELVADVHDRTRNARYLRAGTETTVRERRDATIAEIREVLAALADAGLLLPPDGTKRVQYGTVRPGFVAICSKTTANKVRSVYTGPWIEVS